MRLSLERFGYTAPRFFGELLFPPWHRGSGSYPAIYAFYGIKQGRLLDSPGEITRAKEASLLIFRYFPAFISDGKRHVTTHEVPMDSGKKLEGKLTHPIKIVCEPTGVRYGSENGSGCAPIFVRRPTERLKAPACI